jgi:hypothetical protein
MSDNGAPATDSGVPVEDFYYVTEPTTAYTHNPIRLIYVDWSNRINASGSYQGFSYLDYANYRYTGVLSTVSGEDSSFQGDSIDYLAGSNKFLMVQDSQKVHENAKTIHWTSAVDKSTYRLGPDRSGNVTFSNTERVDSFVFGQHIPRGVLKPGEKYYLAFTTMPWNGFAEELTVRPQCITTASGNEDRTPFQKLRWSHNGIGLKSWSEWRSVGGWQVVETYNGPYDDGGHRIHTLLSNNSAYTVSAAVTPIIEYLDTQHAVLSTSVGERINMCQGVGWYDNVYAFVVPDGIESANLKFICDTGASLFTGIDFSDPSLSEVEGCSVLFDNVGLYPDKPISKSGAFITIAQAYKTKVFNYNWGSIRTPRFYAEANMYLRGVRITCDVKNVEDLISADFTVLINGLYVYVPTIYEGTWEWDENTLARTNHLSYQTSRGIRSCYIYDKLDLTTDSSGWSLGEFDPQQLYAARGDVLGEVYVNSGDEITLECATSKSLNLRIMFDFTKC